VNGETFGWRLQIITQRELSAGETHRLRETLCKVDRAQFKLRDRLSDLTSDPLQENWNWCPEVATASSCTHWRRSLLQIVLTRLRSLKSALPYSQP
jgi:hypothetical protein